jgi:beta-hydroxylase
MLPQVLAPRYLALAAFVASTVYLHFRGRERHKFSRQFLDHSTLMAPYNALMYLFSAVRARPYVDVAEFPELMPLRTNWRMIRDEGLKLFDEGYIRAAAHHNDIGFNSFFLRGWKRFYLKWYDDALPSAAALCPQTTELLKTLPRVNAALFALLPPGSRLGRHRDPYAGSLRYHLGLATPNSELCQITVDGQRYAWHDGEDVIFDETFVHWAENRTDRMRLILLCDIERPLRTPFARTLNRVIGRRMIRAAATQNVEGEHVGVLNHLFGYVYQLRVAGQHLKAWSRPSYYAIKWMLTGALLYAVFR